MLQTKNNQNLGLTGRSIPGRTLFVCLLLGVFLFAAGIQAAWAVQFTDINGHWALSDMLQAVEKGYLRGYPDSTLRPDQTVSRAELVTLINRAFNFSGSGGSISFKDVKAGNWFAGEVEAAVAAGYINGYDDGCFRPKNGATRQEVAVILARILKLESNQELSFSDAVKIPSWARSSVAALASQKIINGYPDHTFRPLNKITRAEAVVLINKAVTSNQATPHSANLLVTGSVVNIRSGPGVGYPVIGSVCCGQLLKSLALSENNWYQVIWQGKKGWITGCYVEVRDEDDSDRHEAAVLNVQVDRKNSGMLITVTGGEDYQWQEKGDHQGLVVQAKGITVVRTPSCINVAEGGIEQILTRVTGQEAVVAINFSEVGPQLSYNVKEEGKKLEIFVPYQLVDLDVREKNEELLLTLEGTGPLNYQSFTLSDPKRLIFDFKGLNLPADFLGWQEQPEIAGISELRLGQFASDVTRLVVESTKRLSFDCAETDEKKIVLKFHLFKIEEALVVLDPGHGGSDPGAVGSNGLREKDVNLEVALQTAELLKNEGVKVLLTREEDIYVGLKERAEISNSKGAAVFVSIHANANVISAIGGTSTYTYLVNSQQKERLTLARLLQEELVKAVGLRDIGVLQENFAVLRHTLAPAALVEMAFLSNASEEQLLADKIFQEKAAQAIAKAIISFLQDY